MAKNRSHKPRPVASGVNPMQLYNAALVLLLALIAMAVMLSTFPIEWSSNPSPKTTTKSFVLPYHWRVRTIQDKPQWQLQLSVQADSLQLATFSNSISTLRGLTVAKAIQRGEPIVTLPTANVLTAANSKCIQTKVVCTSWDALILAVVCERASAGQWAGYLDDVYQTQHRPLSSWPVKALQELHPAPPSTTAPDRPPNETESRTALLEALVGAGIGLNWRGLIDPAVRASRGWQQLQPHLSEDFPSSWYNETSYTQAWHVVQTRAFALQGQGHTSTDNSSVIGLVPFVDFLNHQVPPINPAHPSKNVIPMPSVVGDTVQVLASDDYQACSVRRVCMPTPHREMIGGRWASRCTASTERWLLGKQCGTEPPDCLQETDVELLSTHGIVGSTTAMKSVMKIEVDRTLMLGATASGNADGMEQWMALVLNSSVRMKILARREFEVGLEMLKTRPPKGEPFSAAVGWTLQSTLLPLLLTARVVSQSTAQLQDDACTSSLSIGHPLGLTHELTSARLLFSLLSEERNKYSTVPGNSITTRLQQLPEGSATMEQRTAITFSGARYARLDSAVDGVGQYLACLRNEALLNVVIDKDCETLVNALLANRINALPRECGEVGSIPTLAKALSVRLFNRFAMDTGVFREDRTKKALATHMKNLACTGQSVEGAADQDCIYWSRVANKAKRSMRHDSGSVPSYERSPIEEW